MKRLKRLAILAVILIALLAVLILGASAETVASGTCGDNLTWTLDDAGTLTISGTGPMYDWEWNGDSTPWISYANDIVYAVIEEGVTTIGNDAFCDCLSIKRINIPSSVTSISEGEFTSCIDLTGIWVDENNPNYSSDSYGVLFNKDKTLLIYAHRELEDGYIIPESVTAIGDKAFYNCNGLVDVEISEKVTDIGEGVFTFCYGLNGIWVDENNPNYSSNSDGLLFNKDKSVLIFAPAILEENYVISDGVVTIGDYAFSSCRQHLVEITIPDSVITIGDSAFSGCKSLENVNIGNGVTIIDAYAFGRCNNLTSITIPMNLTLIEQYAFEGCSGLTDVYYYGTEEQREQINIEWGNDYLINANWKYTVGGPVYSDVVATSWQYKAVNYAVENGLMAGKGKDQYGRIVFDPNKAIPREEFVQVLYNAESKPSVSIANKFPDVKNEWYKNAVLWANAKNIASGMGDGRFGVGKNIARQDLAVMLYKYAKMKDCDLTATVGKIAQFADGNKVSGYAKTAMDWAVTKGVLSGKGVIGEPISTFKLDPTGTATRAECAAMLKNFMEAQETPDTPETPDAPEMTAVLTGVEADSIQYYNCKESGNFAVIEKNGKYGIIGYDGETLLPVEYDEIYQGRGFGYDYLWASKGDYFYSIDDNGRAEESWGYPGGDVDPDAYWYNDQLVVFLPGTGEGIIGGLEELSWIAVEQRLWKENAVLPIREMVDITEDRWGQKFPKIENKSFALLDTTTGKLISDFIYSGFDTGNGFSEGILAVKKGDKWGFVDEKGNEVTDFLYDPYEQNDAYEDAEYKYSIFTAANGYIAVKKDGKWGLLDTQGNTVLEAVYDGISQVNPDGMFWLKENSTWTLYQLGEQ